MQRFYRFRSTAALLGTFEELERQEIYFSPPGQLNDPLEGFMNLVWRGDAILWRNLLRHYLLCLLDTAYIAAAAGPTFKPELCRYLVFKTDEDLPDAPIREIYRQVCEGFFVDPSPALLIDGLAARDAVLSRDGLINWLRAIHPLALQAVIGAFATRGLPLTTAPLDLSPFVAQVPGSIGRLFKLHDLARGSGVEVGTISAAQAEQLDLLNDMKDKQLTERQSWTFLYRDMPAYYVDSLQQLPFPQWYTACFVKNPTHPSMWGVYGDGHRGACLEFSAHENDERRQVLSLEGVIGAAGGLGDERPVKGEIAYPFAPVRYANDYPETDFFGNLGRLSRSKLTGFWYVGEDGQLSSRVADIVDEKDGWRQAYWARQNQIVATKLPQWAHEEEYRLILSGTLIDREREPALRKLRYSFSSLTGVIFGMKMSQADKIAMLRILAQKVEVERHEGLRISQATFSHATGRIEIRPLSLLSTQIATLARYEDAVATHTD